MRHHQGAFVLPKVTRRKHRLNLDLDVLSFEGFYGREVHYEHQIKVVQDPISGQILPKNLFDHWWTQVYQYNQLEQTTELSKHLLSEKELKDEFAEIFSQTGCNKSVVSIKSTI